MFRVDQPTQLTYIEQSPGELGYRATRCSSTEYPSRPCRRMPIPRGFPWPGDRDKRTTRCSSSSTEILYRSPSPLASTRRYGTVVAATNLAAPRLVCINLVNLALLSVSGSRSTRLFPFDCPLFVGDRDTRRSSCYRSERRVASRRRRRQPRLTFATRFPRSGRNAFALCADSTPPSSSSSSPTHP